MTFPGDKTSVGMDRDRPSGGLLYGLYAHAAFWSAAVFIWLAALVLPSTGLRWRLMRCAIGVLAKMTGIRVRVHGLHHLPAQEQRCILVANHSSYLDNPLLIHALPRSFSFVAKAELRANPAVHLFLRRIGTEFIERRNARIATRDLRALSALSRQGRSLLFFPEGTIRRDSGLLPFRMGAFITAAGEDIPVVPVAIKGSRSLFADGDRWPRRGEINVTVGRPLHPRDFGAGAGDTRQTAQALRDAARAAILEYCGEVPAQVHAGRAAPSAR